MNPKNLLLTIAFSLIFFSIPAITFSGSNDIWKECKSTAECYSCLGYYCTQDGGAYAWRSSDNPDRCGGNSDGWQCNGNVRENRDYECNTGGTCTAKPNPVCISTVIESEDCSTKASTDTDTGNKPLTAGTVTDYTGCSGGACTSNTYPDSCTGNTLTEYYPSGASYTNENYNCENSETTYCGTGTNANKVYRNEWRCSGTPGYCNDGETDTLIEDCTSRGAGWTCSNGECVGPCSRANPTVAISPTSQTGLAGEAKSYTVTVTNTYSSTSSFSLSSSSPTGWSATFNPSSLSNIPAGSSGTSTLIATSSSTASTGTYTITATAKDTADNDCQNSGTANYVVVCSISGYVYDSVTSNKISSAAVSTTGASDTTDVNGNYELTGLSSGTTYTATASKTGYQTKTVDSQCGTLNIGLNPSDGSGGGDSRPTCSISEITESSSYAYSSGSTVYYNTINTGSFTVKATATDDKGISKVNFPTTVLAGGDDRTSPYTWAYDWDTADTYSSSATVTAYDTSRQTGNCQFTVTRDISKPTTSASITGSYSITLTCSDTESGCSQTKYCTDTANTCTPNTAYTSRLTQSCTSTCYVRYYSTDNVNNQEITKSTPFGPGAPERQFDFGVSISPISGTVTQGSQATATVTANLISGTTQSVSLSSAISPNEPTITRTFLPSSGNPTYTSAMTSAMTVATTASTPAGTYTITITGTGGSLTRTATYTLTVSTAAGCIGGTPNDICQSGETQDNCSDDCKTIVSMNPTYTLPGQEVELIVYFTDSRYLQNNDVKVDLVIDGQSWGPADCVISGAKWKNMGWTGGQWSGMYSNKNIEINSLDGYGKVKAKCNIPSNLAGGTHTLQATPTIFGSEITLKTVETKFTVVDGIISLISMLENFFKGITGSFLAIVSL